MSVLLDGLTVREAAERMGVGRARVQAMIMRNELAAEMVGGRWIVPTDEALRVGRIPRGAGHPLDESTAWRIIGEFDSGERNVDELQLWWGPMVARATSFIGWVLPEHVELFGCPFEAHFGGNRRAAEIGAAVTERAPHDVYLAQSDFPDFADWAGFTRVTSAHNVRVHLVSVLTLEVLRVGVPLAACWLDLADAGDRGANEVRYELRARHAF